MSKNKPGRNDPCWCGSGLEFKFCHYARESESRLPFAAIAHATRKAGTVKICLHPRASSTNCGKVISAHTLQRSRVLKEIADARNHVYSFMPPVIDDAGRFPLQKRGWHDASTFTAFCDKHDAELFSTLEAQEFVASPQQCFLIAYRSICWELHRKIAANKSNPAISKVLDRGTPPSLQELIQRNLSIQRAGLMKGMADLELVKTEMDRALLNGDYSDYRMHEFLLEKPMLVASTGAVTPNRTISGKSLQVIHNMAVKTQWLSFGVDTGERGVSVLFVWRREDVAPADYMKEVLALDDKRLPGFLIQFFFAHCENTYFLDSWWNLLAETDRSYLSDLMYNSNPYYYPPVYRLDDSFGARPLLVSRNIA